MVLALGSEPGAGREKSMYHTARPQPNEARKEAVGGWRATDCDRDYRSIQSHTKHMYRPRITYTGHNSLCRTLGANLQPAHAALPASLK